MNKEDLKFENKTIEVVKPLAKVEQKELVAELPKSIVDMVEVNNEIKRNEHKKPATDQSNGL